LRVAPSACSCDACGARIALPIILRLGMAGLGNACSRRPVSDRCCGGTAAWMAPEVLKDNHYGRKADIWSVGCVMIELTARAPPWNELSANPFGMMYKISCTEELPAWPSWLPTSARDFLRCCLRRDVATRPSASELLKHELLSE
jgi:mitogen-activated protein kinase kinase kinase